jgi:glycosyltransferase involved in cell wall biosynthesis
MIRVLFVSHSSELNGAERMLLDALRRLDRGKFAPLLAVPGPGDLSQEASAIGIESVTFPMNWTLTEKSRLWKQPFSWAADVPGVFRLARFIGERGIELVVTNSAACWAGAYAARRARIPHAWFVHEILDGERPLLVFALGRTSLVRRMLRLSKRIVASSRASARAFGDSSAVAVIGNGIELSPPSVPSPDSLRESLGLGKADLVLGIIGKIYPGKGQKEAVQATGLLRTRWPGVRLLVIGDVEDKSYFAEIRKEIKAMGLDRNVVFTGRRTDVRGILPLLKALVIASSVDSLGRVGLEAMAAGIPVIAAAKGGLPEIIADGRTGLLVDSPDPQGIAAAVIRLLDDPALEKTIAEGGRRFVEANFSLDVQVRKIERVLEECLEK